MVETLTELKIIFYELCRKFGRLVSLARLLKLIGLQVVCRTLLNFYAHASFGTLSTKIALHISVDFIVIFFVCVSSYDELVAMHSF